MYTTQNGQKTTPTVPEGEQIWEHAFQGDHWFWASPITDGKDIFLASMAGTVFALDKDGKNVWPTTFTAESPIVSTPVVINNNLIVATDKGKLHFIDSGSGEKLEVSKDLAGRIKAPLSNQGANVFVGTEEGVIKFVNMEQWIETWQVKTKE